MPSIWRYRLTDNDPPDRRLTHRLLSQWLDIDHHAMEKPWSWSTHHAPTGPVLDIALLNDGLTAPLLQRSQAYCLATPQGPRYPRLVAPPEQIAQPLGSNWRPGASDRSGRFSSPAR